MKKNQSIVLSLWFACCSLFSANVSAETRYVSDQIEATLRTGPTLGHAVQRMLKMGAALEVLEEDTKSGYTRVKTSGGTEGWILSRYLMSEPDAKSQLEKIAKQITNNSALEGSVRVQLTAIKDEYDSMKKRVVTLENENKRLEGELNVIKKTSSNVLSIDRENKDLNHKLSEVEERFNLLLTENNDLSDRKQRDWFVAGALVLLGGMILGLILPALTKRKQSRYGSF
jgi:SH3 domain protein